MKNHFIKTFSTSFTFEAKQNPPEKNFTSWLPYIATIGHSCPGNFKHTLYSKSLEILHITLWDKTLIFAKIHIFNFVKNLGSVTSIFRRWRGDAETCTIREWSVTAEFWNGSQISGKYGWFSHRVGSQYASFERVLAFTCVLNIRRVCIESQEEKGRKSFYGW